MREFETYLFDLDGTLIDTRKMIITCFRDTFEKFGGPLSVSDEEINRLIGIPYRRQIDHFFGTVDDDLYGKIRRQHMKHQMEIFRNELSLCPGVRETVTELARRGKKLGIVTSRTLESGGPFLEWFGLSPLFPVVVTPEHTVKHKPNPEPVREALRLLNSCPEETLFIGDAVFDMEAGRAAGTAVCFTEWSPADPGTPEPDFSVSDMRRLLDFS
ncbi:MAG: HAD-IA family hydrolase [Spirochaetia bacterium]|nr:HAD-IA family hydrolase [Spirochaetia bacterium]